MNGFDAIAALSIAEMDEVVFYQPVSRIMAGGWSNSRPATVVTLESGVLWNDGTNVLLNDDTPLFWNHS
jgi:hypothetical protein